MFKTLFKYRGVIRRHREGPLAAERARYLRELVAQSMAQETILRRARYCLCVAVELQRWPPTHCFNEDEVETLAVNWALGRFACGRASSPRWPTGHFRFAAKEFLRSLGRLPLAEAPKGSRYEAELAEFIASQQDGRWQSGATCRSARWQIEKFLAYLEQRGMALSDVAATDVDAFYQHMAQRRSRISLRTSARMLRAWFGYCEKRGWVRSALAEAVLLPRLYRHEGLPLGPTWETVGRILMPGSDVHTCPMAFTACIAVARSGFEQKSGSSSIAKRGLPSMRTLWGPWGQSGATRSCMRQTVSWTITSSPRARPVHR